MQARVHTALTVAAVGLLLGLVSCGEATDVAGRDSATSVLVADAQPAAAQVVPAGAVASSLSWVWPPPFVVPGTTASLELVSDGVLDAVSVTIGSEPISAAAHDATTARWTVVVQIPATAGGRIDVAASGESGDGVVRAPTLSIPVVRRTEPFAPTEVDATPVSVIELADGEGPAEVGIRYPIGDGIVETPRSLAVEPVSGDIVVLDSVNRRLVRVTATGGAVGTIDLASIGSLEDVVVLGDTQRAVVSEWRGAGGGRVEVSVHDVDLETGAVVESGPALIEPPAPPFGTQLVWNEALDAVYGVVYDPATELVGYHRFYDTDLRLIDVERVPEHWWFSRSDGTNAGIEFDGSAVLTEIPYEGVGVLDGALHPSGAYWLLAGSVDDTAQWPNAAHLYVGRIDLECQAAVLTEVDVDVSEPQTRQIVADRDGVYVVDVAASYRIARYELAAPGCDAIAPVAGGAVVTDHAVRVDTSGD